MTPSITESTVNSSDTEHQSSVVNLQPNLLMLYFSHFVVIFHFKKKSSCHLLHTPAFCFQFWESNPRSDSG